MQEDHNLEFKRKWKDDLLTWFCPFANAQGGTLLLGVDDAVGLPGNKKTLRS